MKKIKRIETTVCDFCEKDSYQKCEVCKNDVCSEHLINIPIAKPTAYWVEGSSYYHVYVIVCRNHFDDATQKLIEKKTKEGR